LEWVPAVYDADLRTLVELINGQDTVHTHMLLVGHNPGMEVLARYFVGSGQRSVTFSPATIVTLRFDVAWAEMGETLAWVEFTR
jgi:phosphohistidine phosphatase